MAGKLVVLIAGTGQGKSTKIKSLIKNAPCLVWDVNGEYDDLEFDANQPRSRFFSNNISDFLAIVPKKHGGTICVFEEATGFFSGAASKQTKQIIVGKRHPVDLGGRNLLFVFHTILSVPPFLLETADTIIVGRTGDEPNRVRTKSSKLYPVFIKMQRAPKYTFFNFKNT